MWGFLSRKKYDMKTVFYNEILTCKDVDFPKNYFERKFISWFPTSEENVEKTISEISYLFEEKGGLDLFIELIGEFEKNCLSSSLFINNEQDYISYCVTGKDISNQICAHLPLYASIRRYWYGTLQSCMKISFAYEEYKQEYIYGLFLKEIKTEQQRIAYKTAMNLANEPYYFALDLKWKKICSSHPEWNTNQNHQVFIDMANSKFENWKDFYLDKFAEFDLKLGIDDYKLVAMEKLNMISDEVRSIFVDGVNKYSSIYEIDDFSEENIDRIVSLYENGIISGAYSKSKDPRYWS